MRRKRVRRVGLALILLGVGVGTARYAAQRVPAVLQGIEMFRVDSVEFEGLRFAEAPDLRQRLGLLADASIWDDAEPLEARLELDPVVAQATLTRDLPSTWVVQIEEAEPVALIATPTLAPIDRMGELLPIDPARHRLDLPILRASLDTGSSEFRTSTDLRALLQEWVHLRDLHPDLAARVSQVGLDDRGAMEVKMFEPDVTLRYRPPASAYQLLASARVAKHAQSRRPDSPAVEVDMRFGDAIVVRYPESSNRSPRSSSRSPESPNGYLASEGR